jgi:anti-sigma-K factor RskA
VIGVTSARHAAIARRSTAIPETLDSTTSRWRDALQSLRFAYSARPWRSDERRRIDNRRWRWAEPQSNSCAARVE